MVGGLVRAAARVVPPTTDRRTLTAPTPPLDRLRRILDLEVVAVRKVPLRPADPGCDRLWLLDLADGRTLALGPDRLVRDRHYLRHALHRDVSANNCKALVRLLHQINERKETT